MLGMPSLTQVPNFILAAVSCFYSMSRLALCADFRQTLLEAADLRKALKDNQRGVKPGNYHPEHPPCNLEHKLQELEANRVSE